MPRPRLQRAATARREKVQLRIREQSLQQDLLKSNVVYVGAPSVSLYVQHIKCFAGDHVASKKLLHDGPVLKSKGHFKTVYSAEALANSRT